MNSNDMILITIVLMVASFFIGRSTYTPDKWVEDKVADTEKRLYERLSSYFDHKMKMMQRQMSYNLESFMANMPSNKLQLKSFNATSMDEMIKKIHSEFRERGIPEKEAREEIKMALNIKDEDYDNAITKQQ